MCGPRVGCGEALTGGRVLIESARASERAVPGDLDAIAGGRSRCSASRQGAPVGDAKHYEGAAAALAEARPDWTGYLTGGLAAGADARR